MRPSRAGRAAPRPCTNCSTPASTRCTTASPAGGAPAGSSSPGTRPTCSARSAPRGSTRDSGTPTTSPGSWPRPGTTARTRPCWTATRQSGARWSPPGCAPPTRPCRCCAAEAVCATSSRARPAATTRCSPTATWAAARSARPARTPTRRSHPGRWKGRSRSTPRPAHRSPTSGSRRRTGPSSSCTTGSAVARCSSCSSRPVPVSGTASTGCPLG